MRWKLTLVGVLLTIGMLAVGGATAAPSPPPFEGVTVRTMAATTAPEPLFWQSSRILIRNTSPITSDILTVLLTDTQTAVADALWRQWVTLPAGGEWRQSLADIPDSVIPKRWRGVGQAYSTQPFEARFWLTTTLAMRQIWLHGIGITDTTAYLTWVGQAGIIGVPYTVTIPVDTAVRVETVLTLPTPPPTARYVEVQALGPIESYTGLGMEPVRR